MMSPATQQLVTLQTEFLQEQTRIVTQGTREIMSLGWADEDDVAHF